MSIPTPPEITAFLAFLAERGVGHCILHALPERGPVSGGGDVDLQVDAGALGAATAFLRREGWREDFDPRFRRSRRYFSLVRGGRKSKLDLTTRFAVYADRVCWEYRAPATTQEGPDGAPYLSAAVGADFLAMKVWVKGGAGPGRGSPPPAPPSVFVPVPAGGWSPWGWLRGPARGLRPATGRLVVALVGLDGAGKGTYGDLLAAELEARGFGVGRRYLGFASFRLPFVRWVIRGRDRQAGGARRALWHAAYLSLLPAEFLARRGRGLYDVLLLDRHPAYEPAFPSPRPSSLGRFLATLTPRPHMVVYLTGDAGALWSRKREMDEASFRSKGAILDALVRERASGVPTVMVDTGEGVEGAFGRILAAVEERLG